MANTQGSRPYSFAPLAHNHFRLLCVSFKKRLPVYRIRHATINNPPTFSALSYTWDDQSRSQTLYVDDGSVLKVTPNVERAMESLNVHGDLAPYSIWVDGVCIDQEDTRDKEAQIHLMGKIYSAASKVIVWLGPSTVQIETALEASAALLLTLVGVPGKIAPERHTMLKYGLPALNSPIWDGLGQLFARPWFSRLWVLQEAVLAQEIDFVCGGRVMDFAYLMNLGEVLKSTGLFSLFKTDSQTYHGQGIPSLSIISDMKRKLARSKNKSISLLTLLIATSERESKEPRDRLYALLGLAPTEVQTKVSIQYDVPPAKVFLNYAKWEVQRSGGPIILLMACVKNEFAGLPSWCPKFDEKPEIQALGMLAHTANYHAGFRPKEKNTTCYVTCIPDSNLIKTQGILVDRITEKIPAGWQPFGALDGHRAKEMAGQGLAWEASCLELSQEIYNQPNTVPEGHWRTLIANKIISDACVVDQLHEYHLLRRLLGHISIHGCQPPNETLRTWEVVGLTVEEMLSTTDYHSSVNQAMHRRSFVSTQRGRIGLVPDRARVGDLICVLYNVSVPLVLRPRAYDEKIFELVGESYVHGLMQGEALELHGQEGIQHFLID